MSYSPPESPPGSPQASPPESPPDSPPPNELRDAWNRLRWEEDTATYDAAYKNLDRQHDYENYKEAEKDFEDYKAEYDEHKQKRKQSWKDMDLDQRHKHLDDEWDLAEMARATACDVAEQRYHFYGHWNEGEQTIIATAIVKWQRQ